MAVIFFVLSDLFNQNIKMGVEICVWRAVIGMFVQPNKCRSHLNGYIIWKSWINGGLRWILSMSILLIISGDIESNPGPTGRGGRTMRNASSSQTVNNSDNSEYFGTRSKQRTLQSYALSQQVESRRASCAGAGEPYSRTENGMSSSNEDSM